MGINPNQNYIQPAYDAHRIHLKEGQSIIVEPSAMLACYNLDVTTGKNDNIFSVASRYFFGGESLFRNEFKAKQGGGWIALEEELPGQIGSYTLAPGTSLMMGRGAFVAADKNVKVITVYGGFSGWWKGLGFAKMKATVEEGESGRVFFDTAKGVVKEIKITREDGPIIVDNDNTVAHSSELTVTVRKLGGIFSTLFSGEGTVNEFRGNGSIFVGSGEKDAVHNVFEQIVNGVSIALIPTKATICTLLGLYVVLNSDVAVKVAEYGVRALNGKMCENV
jgi:uncharacterized protein (TIGR00266 family)